MENPYFSVFMTLVTLFALFGSDLQLSLTDTRADAGFVVCAWVCIGFFALEMGFNSVGYDYYFGGFYFWIDLISTLSILSEIPLVVNAVSNQGTSEMMELGKSGRVGTRASRIIRIVRLVRMVRVVKLYKMHNSNDDALVDDTLEPTQVGKKLTEVTTRRLILVMLTLIMCLPWLQASTLIENSHNFQHYFLKHLHQYPQNYNATGEMSAAAFESQVRFFVKESVYPLLYLEICEPQTNASGPNEAECLHTWSHRILYEWSKDDSNYVRRPRKGFGKNGLKGARERAMSVARQSKHRPSEFFVSAQIGCYERDDTVYGGGLRQDGPTAGGTIDKRSRFRSATCLSMALFSIRDSERLLAVLGILKTIFIMIVLIFASIVFHHDAQVFVIGPIERMMTLVKRLAENPLDAKPAKKDINLQDKSGYETVLLEQTLERIGQLLQVGFGAAGAEIIGKNMNTGALNPMIAGKKITAIYGFCDIRQFTDTTECLQEEVMVYVNKLGNIVHSATHAFYGMANKNVGDAFLLSWKICDGELEGFANFEDQASEAQRQNANETIRCAPQITPSAMADAAICAFLKCQIDLEKENQDGCLAVYASYEAVLRRFGEDFKIQMGFGMHVGWAIEGAIGSDLKIDATYLSPHVEMSDRLEASSKRFGAKLNLSHWLVNLATPAIQHLVRPIAKIRCEGVPCPLTVYTFDLPAEVPCRAPIDWGTFDIPDIVPTFKAGFASFLEGNWRNASQAFSDVLARRPTDGPAKYLINFMAENNNQPPSDWDGTHFIDGF